jgi:hypothetical protein
MVDYFQLDELYKKIALKGRDLHNRRCSDSAT